MYAGLFSEWNSFHSDSTPIPYYVRIYPMYEFTPVYYYIYIYSLLNTDLISYFMHIILLLLKDAIGPIQRTSNDEFFM